MEDASSEGRNGCRLGNKVSANRETPNNPRPRPESCALRAVSEAPHSCEQKNKHSSRLIGLR